MLIKAINMAEAGDVIVADMGKATFNGPFGEVLAVECVSKHLAGLVLNCTIRDSAALVRLGLPIFCTGVCVFGTSKATLGTINHPVVCGGEIVHPGDLILGDDDGIVVISSEKAQWALQVSRERMEKEALVMERLRAGESLFDIYQYQKIFDALGCVEEEIK